MNKSIRMSKDTYIHPTYQLPFIENTQNSKVNHKLYKLIQNTHTELTATPEEVINIRTLELL